MHMHLSSTFGLLAASSWLLSASASPIEKFVRPAVIEGEAMRLLKVSPEDPGTWVTPEDMEKNFLDKNVKFVDITDVSPEELAVLSTPDGADASTIFARQAPAYPTSLSHQTEANRFIASSSVSGPQSWLRSLTNFNNRYYTSTTGIEAGTWLFNQATTLAAPNSAIKVTRFTHSSFRQPSIIVTIPGTSANSVIVGAHYDGVGGASTRRQAADDNGSGTVVLLEALRVLAAANFKPKDTLEIHFYAAEEVGLLGSRDVFANYRSAGKRVLAYLNQDMAGYSPSGKVSVYTDFVDTSLTAYVRLIASTYTGSTPTSSQCGYACSDHGSARSNGFPAAFVTEDVFDKTSPYIHTAQDTYETIQWPAIQRHVNLVIGYLVEASYL